MAQVGPEDNVFEIGPGVGTLTVELAQRAAKVVSVELDRALYPILTEVIAPFPNVTVVQGDALRLDLAAFLREQWGEGQTGKAVANIPYNITSSLLVQLLESKRLFHSLTLMVQKEVADRLRAKPGGDDYGALTVFAQYHATVTVAAVVPRGAFFPPPKVDSAIVHLVPRIVPPVDAPSEEAFFAVSRAAFGQRRKTLQNALTNAPALPFPRETIVAALAAAGVDGQRRGETLHLEEIAAVARALFV
jgi:16S rRNA (adenine1518-N6/adenine1519-N6)-dimethyltransferase